jgi:integrase
VVKVRLEGLKIARARGKYYVYVRATGEALLRGFDGDKGALQRRLSMPDMLGAYNVRRKRAPKSYPEKSLGWLVHWFTTECQEFDALAESTQKQYRAAFDYLETEFDAPVASIMQPELYAVRDKCAADKWPRFADKMITALSSMFAKAIKRGKMTINPALGMDRAHKYDPNSNREWRPDEWKAVRDIAPRHFKVPLMLARHAGFRGQTRAKLQWRDYQADPSYGKCFRLTVRKNKEPIWIPAMPELQSFLDDLDRTSLNISTRADGTPWGREKQLQTAISNWLKGLERRGIVGAGVTLHGLRVTYAAGLRRRGSTTSDVAAALGDRTERMGEHYTRHVENEARVIRAFGKHGRLKRKTSGK